jgi:hypothetical protein
MTNNQKILAALGLGALAVYVYTRMGKKAQTPTSQPQGQDNKPLVNDTRVVDEGKNPISRDKYGMPLVGINTPEQDQKIIEQIVLFEALKQKYGNIRGGNVGDRLTTKYGTYEYRRKQTGAPLGQGFTTTWEKI